MSNLLMFKTPFIVNLHITSEIIMYKPETETEIMAEFTKGTLKYRGVPVLELVFRQHVWERGVLFTKEKGWITIYTDAINQGLFTGNYDD